MIEVIDEATSRFLRAAIADLQRQLGIAGAVTGMTVHHTPTGVALTAQVRVASRQLEFTGSGESLVEAYARLVRSHAEPILAAAYSELLEVPNRHRNAARP